MWSLRRNIRAVLLSGPIAIAPGLVEAQEGDMFISVSPTEGRCPDDARVLGYIGYEDLECNCSFSIGPDGPIRYDFRAEPIIGGVEAGSPADGKLRAGDVIVAVDGYLITTREGGRRFARLTPGEPVTFTVRRRGREMDVSMVPARACFEVVDAPEPRAPEPPATARHPTPQPDVAAPLTLHRARPVEAVPDRWTEPAPPPPPPGDVIGGRFGFSIKCTECRFEEAEGVAVWDFAASPEVDRVEPGSPAHNAGIRAGDRLTHINGRSLTSALGGQEFGAVEPGDTVAFRYRRNTSILETRIVAEPILQVSRPFDLVPKTSNPPPPPPPVTRYSGMIGDAQVLVTGGPVTVNRTPDEIVIQAGDITVRVRRTGGTEGSAHS